MAGGKEVEELEAATFVPSKSPVGTHIFLRHVFLILFLLAAANHNKIGNLLKKGYNTINSCFSDTIENNDNDEDQDI